MILEQYGKMIDEQVLAMAGKDEGDGLVITLPPATCSAEEIALKVLRQELGEAGFKWDG